MAIIRLRIGLGIRRGIARSSAALGLLLFSWQAYAAVPVEDSLFRAAAELDSGSTDFSDRDSNNTGSKTTGSFDIGTGEEEDLWSRAGQENLATGASDQPLFYQVQLLQQQVRELRGLVEEQAYVIQKLQQDQRAQYVDLDRRVAALAPNRPAPGPTPIPAQAPVLTDRIPNDVGQTPDPGLMVPDVARTPVQNLPTEPPATEREAYAQAIELMRGKEFDRSTQAFEQLIVDYPNGQFTPNAFYWLGELNLATDLVEPARQNFVQVIRLYPDHQKVPDALYKLGVLYFQLGDETEARRYLQQVQSEYPQSSAGSLAKRYLAEME